MNTPTHPRSHPVLRVFLIMICLAIAVPSASEEAKKLSVCFESREGASEIDQKRSADGEVNLKCSETTGAVLWWRDPFEGTIPLQDLPGNASFLKGEAVVRPRSEKSTLLPLCGVACHNGTFPPPSTDKLPRKLTMHMDVVPDSMNLQHGRGSIWCLDCHHTETRNQFVDHFGNGIDFNEPQKLCGKCHGPAYRDWRSGIHGKRIGEWASDGKKRWYVCTECHNPHDVQQGSRNSGFSKIKAEPAPMLPKGLDNADHERH